MYYDVTREKDVRKLVKKNGQSPDNHLGNTLKRRRLLVGLTLAELGQRANVSASYLGRIERGEMFPSNRVLRKIAEPLGFGEAEMLFYAVIILTASNHSGSYEAGKKLFQALKEIKGMRDKKDRG